MQNEKQVEASVFIYFGLLLILGIVNLSKNINIVDMGYLLVVICCALKIFIIVKHDWK